MTTDYCKPAIKKVSYWDKRYEAEGRIWGDLPSPTAAYALEQFRGHRFRSVLVPGSGYGRNTRLFSGSGLEVTGIEKSPLACEAAREFDPRSRFYNASPLDMSFIPEKFDALYCFNVLQFFREAERRVFLEQCRSRMSDSGLMYFTVFSEQEKSYGTGQETERNTFESQPGRPVHYFTADDLLEHFKGTEVIELGVTEDTENHGEEGLRVHRLRYVVVKYFDRNIRN